MGSGVNNTFYIMTADSPSNETGCSPDSRAILTVKMGGTVSYGDVLPSADGCIWEIDFQDGTSLNAPIPSGYTGSANCYYTPSNISFIETDAMADAMGRLLPRLDLDGDGRIDIKFNPDLLSFDVGRTGGVRSLWGPAQLQLVVWT
jgi:hypothetical protein